MPKKPQRGPAFPLTLQSRPVTLNARRRRAMTNFSDRGFLAENLSDALDSKREEWNALHELSIKISEYAWQLQSKLKIDKTNVNHLLAAALFARTISIAQAFLLLVPKGMRQELKLLTRCLLEPLFPLVAISKDENFARAFIASEEIERNKKLKGLLAIHAATPIDGVAEKELEAKIQESDKNIKENKISKVTVFRAAQLGGLEAWYKSLYSLMSDTLHASPRSLEELMVISEDRTKVEALQNLPEFSEHPDLLTTVAEALLHSILAVSTIFEIEVHEFVECQSGKLRDVRTTSD